MPQKSVSESSASARLLVVSNRLPVTVSLRGGELKLNPSSGGLAKGMSGPHQRTGGLWIGWPGPTAQLDEPQHEALARECAARRIVPVLLEEREVRGFYEDVSNGVIWPVFHDRLDRLPLRAPHWEIYEQVNARFAAAVADVYEPGDVIWVHDYQLLRLPALLRRRLPNARIGFFLHIPFPAPGIFEALPTRDELLSGMLGADLIGFHTRGYAANFAASVERLCGLSTDANDRIPLDSRGVQLGTFPMGIDATAFVERAATDAVKRATTMLLHNGCRLLVGVDRLDYSKGIPRRLLALEDLLTRYPEWRGRLRLVQVAVPSRGGVHAYQRFRREVDELVGRINGMFATPSWSPIHYLHASVSGETLSALYCAADVMLVTPVRDGMNLVAKEFVASRIDDDGVLILSEFAGAADELSEAMLINPYDTHGMADAMHEALSMPQTERRTRMKRLRARVLSRDVHWWA
jgi:trehalose 6-phosphate synthase/phosphatase